jgi:hypothetical protein
MSSGHSLITSSRSMTTNVTLVRGDDEVVSTGSLAVTMTVGSGGYQSFLFQRFFCGTESGV